MGSRIDEPLIMTRSSTTYYYNTDGLGSIRQVLNSSGSIVESYDYDPYGSVTIYNSSLTDITSSGSGIDNPYMFTGRRFDEETGIYHYRNRAYDPAIGRFLQRDPLGYVDGMNLFEYVGSNPVNYVDPLGLQLAGVETIVITIIVVVGYICTPQGQKAVTEAFQVVLEIPVLLSDEMEGAGGFFNDPRLDWPKPKKKDDPGDYYGDPRLPEPKGPKGPSWWDKIWEWLKDTIEGGGPKPPPASAP